MGYVTRGLTVVACSREMVRSLGYEKGPPVVIHWGPSCTCFGHTYSRKSLSRFRGTVKQEPCSRTQIDMPVLILAQLAA